LESGNNQTLSRLLHSPGGNFRLFAAQAEKAETPHSDANGLKTYVSPRRRAQGFSSVSNGPK